MTEQADKKNLQTIFLNKLRKDKAQVTVFLHNGVKLQGVITWFDNFCLLLRRHDSQQLVYKHSVATIMPRTAVDLRSELTGSDDAGGTMEAPEENRRGGGSDNFGDEEQDDWF